MYRYYEHYKEVWKEYNNADSYFYVLTSDNDKVEFDEDSLIIQTLYIKIESGKDYSVEELKKAYVDRNNLFNDYMDCCVEFGSVPTIFKNSVDGICLREWGEFFCNISSEQQDEAVKIYLKEQMLVSDYYGDERIKLYKLTYLQQMEFYELYKDASYVFDDEFMETDEPFCGKEKYVKKHLVITKIEGDTITLTPKEGWFKTRYIGKYKNANEFEVDDIVCVEYYFFTYEDSFFGYVYKYYNIQFEKIEKE
ncbi:MAG: hypothetical protein K6G87_18460 [Butyrivibrio sp.]|uniref:hypothetical protein n=1 Tax=Butyrivibrio sp. TaxID=28121 RepID=UPI0025EB2769|nr:hypothetical protein [Butyrivibrio sp.]MCR5773209.1 hypothetical protein [Butyrivibrio sp.]